MRSYAIYVNFLLLYLIERTPAQAVNIVLYADVMYVKGGHIEQEVSYLLSGDIRASLKLECFRYVPGQDSILIGRTHLNGKKLKKGVGTVRRGFRGLVINCILFQGLPPAPAIQHPVPSGSVFRGLATLLRWMGSRTLLLLAI
jgi:hypothetical protein